MDKENMIKQVRFIGEAIEKKIILNFSISAYASVQWADGKVLLEIEVDPYSSDNVYENSARLTKVIEAFFLYERGKIKGGSARIWTFAEWQDYPLNIYLKKDIYELFSSFQIETKVVR